MSAQQWERLANEAIADAASWKARVRELQPIVEQHRLTQVELVAALRGLLDNIETPRSRKASEAWDVARATLAKVLS